MSLRLRIVLAVLLLVVLQGGIVRAAVAFGSISLTAGAGTTAVAVPYPTGISAGDMLVLCVSFKYPGTGAVTTPAGWTVPVNNQGFGNSGPPAADSGSNGVWLFWREATGAEAGDLAVAIPGGNTALGVIARYTKAGGTTWSVAAAGGGDSTTAGTTVWTWTGSTDPGVESGDMVIACNGVNTDLITFTGHVLTQTGVTYATATERWDSVTTQGDDSGLFVADALATAGTSSAPPVYTAVSSAVATNRPAGGGVALRMREVGVASSGWPLGSRQLLLSGH